MKKHLREYTVIVEKDPESGWLVGEVAELPGCYTQAKTLEALQRNIQDAVRAYVKTQGAEKFLPEFIGTLKVAVAA